MYINNNSSYLAAYQATASMQTASATVSGSYLDIVGNTNGSYSAVNDDVDVSETAKQLLERIRDLDVFSIIFPNKDVRQKTKSLDEVEGDFLSDFNDFASTFGKMSQLMGLSGSDSFTMGLDGVGGMTVSGTDDAAAAKLQNGFSQNSTMVARFAVMAARAALADAGNTVDGFKDAYVQDPEAAIKNNIDALKERLLGFRTVSGDGSMQYGFMRDFELEYSSTTASYAAGAAAEVA